MTDDPMHMVLVGDSIFDNAPYTDGGPAVIDHLQAKLKELGDSHEATLVAVDGAVTTDVADQLPRVPASATHLVLSVGGNDGLNEIDVLCEPAERVADGLNKAALMVERFASRYRKCLDGVLALELPTAVCLVYNADFPIENGEKRILSAMLALFNNAIMQIALDYGLPIIDMRRVCTLSSDYVQTIEPSVEGGRKIAMAALESVELNGRDESVVVPSGAAAAV